VLYVPVPFSGRNLVKALEMLSGLPHAAKFIDDPQQDDGNLGSPFKTVVSA